MKQIYVFVESVASLIVFTTKEVLYLQIDRMPEKY